MIRKALFVAAIACAAALLCAPTASAEPGATTDVATEVFIQALNDNLEDAASFSKARPILAGCTCSLGKDNQGNTCSCSASGAGASCESDGQGSDRTCTCEDADGTIVCQIVDGSCQCE